MSTNPICSKSSNSRRLSRRVTPLVVLFLSVLLFTGLAKAQTPTHPGGWVVIGVDEYKALRAKAFPDQVEPEPPPVDATLSRVDYNLRVNGDLAAGEATLTIDVLKEGWVRVAMPSGLFVREAHLDGKPVSLVTAASGKNNCCLRQCHQFPTPRCRSSAHPRGRPARRHLLSLRAAPGARRRNQSDLCLQNKITALAFLEASSRTLSS